MFIKVILYIRTETGGVGIILWCQTTKIFDIFCSSLGTLYIYKVFYSFFGRKLFEIRIDSDERLRSPLFYPRRVNINSRRAIRSRCQFISRQISEIIFSTITTFPGRHNVALSNIIYVHIYIQYILTTTTSMYVYIIYIYIFA